MEKKWTSPAFWENKAHQAQTVIGLFKKQPITRHTVFLWMEYASPMTPCMDVGGAWAYFPEAKALVGYLRYLLFPSFFDLRLFRWNWDPGEEPFLPAEELFRRAKDSERLAQEKAASGRTDAVCPFWAHTEPRPCGHVDEIPWMEQILQDLVDLLHQDAADAETLKRLRSLLRRFNRKWSTGWGYSFSALVYDSPMAVGRRIARGARTCGLLQDCGLTKKKWLEICGKVLSDRAAQKKFLEVLKEDVAC